MNLRPLVLVLLSSLLLAACGDSGEESPSAPAASVTADTNPGQTVPATQTETPTTATAAPDETATAETTTSGGEPNAGDEEGIRVPAAYRYENGALTPRTVSVPAYLRVELSVDNRDAGEVTVSFRGITLKVPAGASKSTFVDGLKPGRYPVTAGSARAVLVSGAEPGP